MPFIANSYERKHMKRVVKSVCWHALTIECDSFTIEYTKRTQRRSRLATPFQMLVSLDSLRFGWFKDHQLLFQFSCVEQNKSLQDVVSAKKQCSIENIFWIEIGSGILYRQIIFGDEKLNLNHFNKMIHSFIFSQMHRECACIATSVCFLCALFWYGERKVWALLGAASVEKYTWICIPITVMCTVQQFQSFLSPPHFSTTAALRLSHLHT